VTAACGSASLRRHDAGGSSARAADRAGRPDRIDVVGPLSGPVTGRKAVTRHVVERLRRAGASPRLHDLSPASTALAPIRVAAKLLATARAALALRRRDGRGRAAVYLVADHRAGIWGNVLVALAARGAPTAPHLVVHHHAANYLRAPVAGMRLLVRAAGMDCVHVVQCERMAAALRAAYPGVRRHLALSNAAWIDAGTGERPAGRGAPFRIGHLGNLSRTKGLETVSAVFEALRADHDDIELVLAGPSADARARREIRRIRARFGDTVRHLGPVSGEAKARFFDEIDAFLFPTIYAAETEGLVTLEAMAAGVPVIAYGRMCIRDNLRGLEGMCVSPDDDFLEAARATLETWREQPEQLAQAREAARARFLAVQREAHAAAAELVALLGAAGTAPGAAGTRERG